MSQNRLLPAIERIKSNRQFANHFLDELTPDEWFGQPQEGVTHIAWQVGHLAFAQYALCMRRLRGERDADKELISAQFIDSFGRGSQPNPNPDDNPTPEEIRRVYDAVHEQTLVELPTYTDEVLDVPVDPPHPVYDTKLEAVEWCSQHELLHVGQIVLLRRLLGRQPQF